MSISTSRQKYNQSFEKSIDLQDIKYQNQTLKNENRQLNNRLQQLMSINQQLRQCLQEVNQMPGFSGQNINQQQIQTLALQCIQLQQQLDQQRTKSKGFHHTICELRQKLQSSNDQKQKTEQMSLNLVKVIQQCQSQSQQLRKELEQLQSESTNQLKQLKEFQQIKQRYHFLTQQCVRLNQDVERKDKEIQILKVQRNSNLELQNIQQLMVELEENIEEKSRVIKVYQQLVTNLRNKIISQ